ncbi:MAG: hypothetical protein OEY61_12925 [Gammaproteobacteria bacterium]|nr:hypothetical protein [Gammaproteobacteria bacterium]MDH5473749.1 hypothetical protein [Gammaproteobacteria bacterium]
MDVGGRATPEQLPRDSANKAGHGFCACKTDIHHIPQQSLRDYLLRVSVQANT